MKWFALVAVFCASLSPLQSQAATLTFHQVPLRCIDAAAHRYGLAVPDIYAILRTEGGRIGSVVPDPNGTSDLGPAQVNTCHLPFLSHYGYTFHTLAYNPCANIMASSWIFARCLAQTSGPLQAAACYNAGGRPWLAWQSGYVQRFSANLGAPVSLVPVVYHPPKASLYDASTNTALDKGLL